MPVVLHIDFETYSLADIKRVGTYAYAQDPSTEILCVAYALGDEEPKLWAPGYPRKYLLDLIESLKNPEVIVAAHNAMFERAVMRHVAIRIDGSVVKLPLPPVERWKCTMAKARYFSFPGDLLNVSKIMGLEQVKQEEGKRLIGMLSKPYGPKRVRRTPQSHPCEFEALYEYCRQDVRTEREVDRYLRDLPAREQMIWQMDMDINDSGVCVDMCLVEKALYIRDEEHERLEKEAIEICGLRPSQGEKIKDWVGEHCGVRPDSMDRSARREIIDSPDTPDKVADLMAVMNESNNSAVAKYDAIRRSASPDLKVRGMLRYYGADTGRWSSSIVQLQNLRRCGENIDLDVDLIKTHKLAGLRWLGYEPMILCAESIRGAFLPDPGCDMVSVDFSAVEAIALAWAANDFERLNIFKSGLDVYKSAATKIYRVEYDAVDKAMRSIGKIFELSMGYGGGEKAAVGMAQNYGIELSEDQAKTGKAAWRAGNMKIVEFWYELNDKVLHAVKNPKTVSVMAFGTSELRIMKGPNWLMIKLPSGRTLNYFNMHVALNRFGRDGLCYYGLRQVGNGPRKWDLVDTWGGRLTENVIQAICRDLLAELMLNLHANFKNRPGSARILFSVHDEIVLSVEKKFSKSLLAHVEALTKALPEKINWAAGMPLAASGWIGARYRKD